MTGTQCYIEMATAEMQSKKYKQTDEVETDEGVDMRRGTSVAGDGGYPSR